MDPISQGTFGGVFSQFFSSKKKITVATVIGIISGLAPDLDVFIKSSYDPLLSLEYHRQFTHSFIFIPFGALIVTLFTYYFVKKYVTFFENYIFAFVGYSTHALLDACTSYGTQLFWPFSNYRFAWNSISIIDPLLTIPILILMILAIILKKKFLNIIGLIWIFLYLGFGFFQSSVALKEAKNLAKYRNHDFKKITVKPSLGNLFLWKIVYLYEGKYYVDSVNLIGQTKFCFGETIDKLDTNVHYKKLNKQSKQFKDILRFSWFSQDYLAYDKDKDLIIDVRYSAIPNEAEGLWGIKINSDPNYKDHVKWVVNRGNFFEKGPKFKAMLFGDFCDKEI